MLPIEYSFKKLFHLRFLQEAKISFKKRDVSPKSKIVCCILAQTFNMKKLLLISMLTVFSVQTFSYTPVNSAKNIISYAFGAPVTAMTLQEFMTLTPKRYQELTGKRMTFKQKIAFAILKAKLKKQLPDDKSAPHKTDIGLLSLIFGGSAFLIAFIPFVGIASIPLAIAAIVLGIIGLGRKKGDTKSIIGLVLGSVFILLIAVAVAAFAAGGWY